MTAKDFLTKWHDAVKNRDAEALKEIIAPDCELNSPVVWKPSSDRDYLLHVLQGIIETVEGFSYRQEWIDGDDIILEFTGTVNGKSLVGIDKITLDENGHMRRIEVLIRPLNTLVELAARMREHVLKRYPEGKA